MTTNLVTILFSVIALALLKLLGALSISWLIVFVPILAWIILKLLAVLILLIYLIVIKS